MEQPRVSRLVPGEHLAAPAELQIALAQHLAEHQDGVVVLQRETGDSGLVRDRAVMCVVEQQGEAATIAPKCAQLRDQRRVVPLMYQNHVRFVDCGRMVEAAAVALHGKLRERSMEPGDRLRAVAGDEVLPAPAILRLKRQSSMPARLQLTQHAA